MNIVNNLQRKSQQIQDPKVAIVSITKDGHKISRKIQRRCFSSADAYVRSYQDSIEYNEFSLIDGSAFKTLQAVIQDDYALIIAIMAAGITVRAIAPFIQDKTIDPAIVVIDDQGKFVISLLSGHVGHANEWARMIAREIEGEAVITTATDAKKRMGIDELAKHVDGYYRNFKEQTRRFNQMIAEDTEIALVNETDLELPKNIGCFNLMTIAEWSESYQTFQGIIIISNRPSEEIDKLFITKMDYPYVQIIPRRYIVGVGCRRDTSYEIILENFKIFMQTMNLDIYSVNKLVSIDVKKDEFAIISLAQMLGMQFETFSKEILEQYEVLYPGSAFVKQTVGVSSVAQTSAHHESKGQVLSERYANQGVTFALARY